ncbi:hypothetical protein FF1_037135 [Malus domestica]
MSSRAGHWHKAGNDEGVIIDDHLEGDVDDEIEENKAIMLMMLTINIHHPNQYDITYMVQQGLDVEIDMMLEELQQLNLILSKLVDRDEDVKSKSSRNVEKPLHFVSYSAAISAAAAVVAMTAGLTDPAGVDPDDDEGVLTDEDDGDDLKGDADNEMEKDEDDNGDDGNGGGVGIPVEIVGYGVIIDDDDLEGDVDGETEEDAIM